MSMSDDLISKGPRVAPEPKTAEQRGSTHRSLVGVTVVLSLLIIFAFSLSALSIYNSHKDACDARNVTLTVMADILAKAQKQTDADPNIPPAKKAESDRFVTQALASINAAGCNG